MIERYNVERGQRKRNMKPRSLMRLAGSDGSAFEMSIVGYEFSDLQPEVHDSNWLRIWIHVVHPRGEWSSIDASLLTWEVEELAQWFEAVAGGKPVKDVMSFLEPNLSFRLLEREKKGNYLQSASSLNCARNGQGPNRFPWENCV